MAKLTAKQRILLDQWSARTAYCYSENISSAFDSL